MWQRATPRHWKMKSFCWQSNETEGGGGLEFHASRKRDQGKAAICVKARRSGINYSSIRRRVRPDVHDGKKIISFIRRTPIIVGLIRSLGLAIKETSGIFPETKRPIDQTKWRMRDIRTRANARSSYTPPRQPQINHWLCLVAYNPALVTWTRIKFFWTVSK